MIKNRSIIVKILLGFFIVILLFSSAVVLNYSKLKDVKTALNENNQRSKDENNAMEINTYVGILYSNQADVIINQSEESIVDYKKYAITFKKLIEDVSKS